MKHIILYSGSFSPITYGHYLVIIKILKQYPFSKMIISPVNDNYAPGLLPYADRLNMVKLTIDWIKKDYPFDIEASDFMSYGTQPYNDAEWIAQYNHPSYLIGSDIDVSTWRKKDQEALKKTNVIVTTRENDISSYDVEKKYVETGQICNLIPPVKDYFSRFSREYIRKLIT